MLDDKNQNRRFRARLTEPPKEIVVLTSSARALCDLMVGHLRPNSGNVIELGAGIGKVTESLLAHGFRQNQLALFEINPTSYATLCTTFPDCHVLEMPAEQLRSAPLLNVQAVISSLPFSDFRKAMQKEILSEAFRKMKPGGVFVQYTYGIKLPVVKSVCRELKIAITSLGHVGNTLPPARVYEFRKAYV